MKSRLRTADQFNKQNLECAVLILGDPVQFPEGSGGERWARLFLERREREQQREVWRQFQGGKNA